MHKIGGPVMLQRISICLLLIAIAGCRPADFRPENPAYRMTVTPAEQQKRLDDLFNCDECVNGQLRRVQELGNSVVADLENARNSTVASFSASNVVLNARCNRVATHLALTAAATTEYCQQYVQRFKLNAVNRYRARATQALLAIRTESACNVIGRELCDKRPPFEPATIDLSSDRSTRHVTDP